MLATQQPVLRRFWYPVMPVSALADGPKPFRLLGEDLVLWLAAPDRPAQIEPHRRITAVVLGEAKSGEPAVQPRFRPVIEQCPV